MLNFRRLALAVAVLLLISSAATVRVRTQGPSGFVVNTTDDTDDGACSPEHCSLSEAIDAANADPDATTITFDPALTASGPATIHLLTDLPGIMSSITISGPGASRLTLNGNGRGFPMLMVSANQQGPEVDVNFSGLTIKDGGAVLIMGRFLNSIVTLTDCVITENSEHILLGGGGIHLSSGTLNMRRSTASLRGVLPA